jgi:hypothetical protein
MVKLAAVKAGRKAAMREQVQLAQNVSGPAAAGSGWGGTGWAVGRGEGQCVLACTYAGTHILGAANEAVLRM